MSYYIVTSNKEKIKEYEKYGCPYPSKNGLDLKEPDAEIEEIVVYKCQQNGVGSITEDTCLFIDNCPYAGNLIRFIQETLTDYIGNKAVCEVAIGKHNGDNIHIFIGRINGIIVQDRSNGKAFGFDGCFLPEGSTKTLWELDQEDNKHLFCARYRALQLMLNNQPESIFSSDHPEWNGPWQKDDILNKNQDKNNLLTKKEFLVNKLI